MKTKLLVLSIAVLYLSGAPAIADYDSGLSVVQYNAGYYTAGGGEFTLSTATLDTSAYSVLTKDISIDNYVKAGPGYPENTTMTTSFQTFCVEKNENISPLHMVEETVVSWNGSSSYAWAGGLSGGSPDPLDPRTAYLYTQFATGILSSYNYALVGVPSRVSDADELQQAIYYIEGEIGLTWNGSAWVQTQTPTQALGDGSQALAWYNEAVANAGQGIGNVRVLNLYDHSDITPLQDVLYLVPVPGAVLLGILGLSVAGIKLRKYA